MNEIEGIVIACDPSGIRPTITIQRDDGLRYWGTWPTALFPAQPETLIGRRIVIKARELRGDVEWWAPRNARVIP
jgi:hypothetical protein